MDMDTCLYFTINAMQVFILEVFFPKLSKHTVVR